jgi:hypothetical protein
MMQVKALLVLVFVAVLVVGCGGKKQRIISPDPKFSMNLIKVPKDWPDEERDWPLQDPQMAAVQKDAYEEHGAPDFFRVVYDRGGRIMTRAELQAEVWMTRNSDQKPEPPEVEWIYLGEEPYSISFGPKGALKRPLRDDIRILTEYGDPHDAKVTNDALQRRITAFSYFDRGKIFRFHEGKLVEEQDVTPMPGMVFRQ